MKKHKSLIWIALIVISTLILILGCNSRENITKNDNLNNSKSDYTFEVDTHNYILLNYFQQVEYIDFEKIIGDNLNQFVVNDKIDYDLFAEFVVDNIDLFVNRDLWENITKDAEVVFNIPTGSLYVPFSNGLIKYADLDGSNGGYNFFIQDPTDRLNEMIRYAEDNIKSILSPNEYDNYMDILTLSNQSSISYQEMQDFYYNALSDPIFSENYKEILSFGLNDINFKKYLDHNEDSFNACYKDIWGGSADIGVRAAAYDINSKHCSLCSSICAVPTVISHAQHVSISNGTAGHASAEAGFWCGILNSLHNLLK